MSLRYLQYLAEQRLPFRTSDQGEIDHVAILNAALLITATIPTTDRAVYMGDAVVAAITQAGRNALKTMRLHCERPT